jgi:hypothetical protein
MRHRMERAVPGDGRGMDVPEPVVEQALQLNGDPEAVSQA